MSFVVIGRNEGERLERCLASIRDADYPAEQIELIYVDTNSTDGSCAKAEQAGARVIRINPERPSAAAGRNAGFRVAAADLVHFLDGDTILDPDWLRVAVAAMADTRVACVFGRRNEIAPRATVYNFWAHHDWHQPPGSAESCGGDALFRREALREAGGFDETLIAGEEPDLCYRIRTQQGRSVLSLDAPMTRHDMNMTRFGQYWRRCVRTGHSYAELARRHPRMRRWQRTQYRILAHGLAPLLAAGLSLALRSWWPIGIYIGLLVIALLRNAYRLRGRFDDFGDSLLYAFHHYLSKLPMCWGECAYWARMMLRRRPQTLIEYRS